MNFTDPHAPQAVGVGTCGTEPANRLSRAQTAAALARVEQRGAGFTYWTKNNSAPTYATRKEAEHASIEEWRANL